MTIVFDGKKFAKEREKALKKKVNLLKKRGVKPKLVSILIGDDAASKLYLKLKKKAAKRVGIEMGILQLDKDISPQKIIGIIKKLNKNRDVHGIMVQLPLPLEIDNWKFDILESIDSKKDVDGLTNKSPFVTAAARAVSLIVEFATSPLAYSGKKASVVGSNGMVGRAVMGELKKLGYKVTGCDVETRDLYAKLHEADLIVAATGVPNLVKKDMIKEGVIAIDVGAPSGDISFEDVSKRASFITPVPGGVGPVTITCLLENVIDAAYNLSV
jgi:methylenetetrahydrofolate dehydrogenase (NADP+)/methenyltetrahydrofolate cyclohydrolase